MKSKKLSKWKIFERVVAVVGLIGISFSVYAYYFRARTFLYYTNARDYTYTRQVEKQDETLSCARFGSSTEKTI